MFEDLVGKAGNVVFIKQSEMFYEKIWKIIQFLSQLTSCWGRKVHSEHSEGARLSYYRIKSLKNKTRKSPGLISPFLQCCELLVPSEGRLGNILQLVAWEVSERKLFSQNMGLKKQRNLHSFQSRCGLEGMSAYLRYLVVLESPGEEKWNYVNL